MIDLKLNLRRNDDSSLLINRFDAPISDLIKLERPFSADSGFIVPSQVTTRPISRGRSFHFGAIIMPYKNPEEARASNRRSYAKHGKRWNATFRKKYREDHKDEAIEYAANYRNENRDMLRQKANERLKNDPELRARRVATSKKWREDHPELFAKYKKKHLLKSLYGLTVEEFEAMAEKQNYQCAICFETRPLYRISQKDRNGLCVDHNHESGVVRGLLCDICNRGLGLMKDNPIILRAAAEYLEQYQ